MYYLFVFFENYCFPSFYYHYFDYSVMRSKKKITKPFVEIFRHKNFSRNDVRPVHSRFNSRWRLIGTRERKAVHFFRSVCTFHCCRLSNTPACTQCTRGISIMLRYTSGSYEFRLFK
jgi:hypothetical protein